MRTTRNKPAITTLQGVSNEERLGQCTMLVGMLYGALLRGLLVPNQEVTQNGKPVQYSAVSTNFLFSLITALGEKVDSGVNSYIKLCSPT